MSWTQPGQGYNLQEADNSISLSDIDQKEFKKFKKEFDKVAKKMSGLKPEYDEGGGIYGPYGSMYIDGMKPDVKQKVIKAIEDTLKKLRIKSYDFRRNPG
jgi:hypothetical protein